MAVFCLPAAAAPAGGLRGLVTRGPVRPVCVASLPCSAPASHVVLTFRRGALVRATRTGADGRYRIDLPPGRYAVTLAPGGLRSSPGSVVVPRGRIAVANFSIDTGIR